MYQSIQLLLLILVITACSRPKNVEFPVNEQAYDPPKVVNATPTAHPIPKKLAKTPLRKPQVQPAGQPTQVKTNFEVELNPQNLPKISYLWDEKSGKLLERNQSEPLDTPKSYRIGKPKKTLAQGKIVIAIAPISTPLMPLVTKDNDVYGILGMGQDQGLPSNHIECFVTDTYGRIWIGTDNGLVLIEGNQIKTYTIENGLSSNHVSCLLVEDDKLWIGTYAGGLNLFEKGCFTHYGETNGLSDNDINDIIKVGNKLWIATSEGLNVLENDAFTIYTEENGLSSNQIMCLLAQNDRLWIGTYKHGLNLLENDQMTQYTTKNGLSSNYIRSLVKDGDKLWIGTEYGGLNLLEDQQFTHYTTRSGLVNNNVTSVLKDGSKLWIGTIGGLNLLDNQVFTHFTGQNGLTSNRIFRIGKVQGRIWIGTESGGVNLLQPGQMTHYGVNNGLADTYISSLFEENGQVWMGSYLGLSRLKEGQFTHYNTSSGLCHNYVWSIVGNTKKLWIGTSGGIDLLQNDEFTHYNQKNGLKVDKIWSLMEDGAKLWIGYNGDGFSVLANGEFTHYDTKSGLSNNYVSCFAKTKDKYWIGTNGGGINLLEKGRFLRYTTTNGLSHDQVTSLLVEKGRLWVGTNGGGVNLIENGKIIQYGKKNGLADNSVTQLALDSLGQVWVGTNRGLTRFVRQKNGTYGLQTWAKSDGFKFISFNGYGSPMVIDAKSRLWASVGEVLTAFQLPETDTIAPQLFLTEIDVKQKPVNWLKLSQFKNLADTLYTVGKDTLLVSRFPPDTSRLHRVGIQWGGVQGILPYYLPKNLVLPFDQNHLTFHFRGLKSVASGEITYRYILVGLDAEWSAFTKENKAEYKNIPPGKYYFKVRAKGRNNQWSDEISFAFKITYPWWQSWWAYVLYAVLAGLLVYGFTAWRTRALKTRQKLLEGVVNERTTDLREANEELRAQKEEIFTRNEELRQSQEELEAQRDYIAKRNEELIKKNTQIHQSIKAAQNIQQALLPSQHLFAENFKEYFIFFRPRDVVSGDFYWLNKTDDALWLAVADCTGHGVPGAFMTMLGKSLLERLINIKGVQTPAEVLQKLDEEVIRTLRQKETNNRSGMDIILLKITKNKTVNVQYAGAKNSLYVVDKHQDITVYKADRISIGGVKRRADEFTNQTVKITRGSTLFLSTDGYEDQNDVERKPFTRGALRTLLQEIGTLTADRQCELMAETLATHMEGTEQRDDILVVGVRL
ncbi:MAG TPA: hypothetical protein DCS93_29505 [Microscillaceae bacterium]|nr:hypothetical protein [Microscillaceae bacterium]